MINIVLPISREDYLKRVFESLENLDVEGEEANLITYVDGHYDLFTKARNLTAASKFSEKLCLYRNKGIGSQSSFFRRRERISKIHNELKSYIKAGEYVFLVEDDTLVPPNALKGLLSIFSDKDGVAIASGVELGRWGFNHIGAWISDNLDNPNQITSVEMGEGIKEVTATGFYCTLVKAEYYLDHEFKPFEKALGPDFEFGLTMRRKGLKNYINFDIKCDHLTKKETIRVEDSYIDVVKLTREGDKWSLANV